ncbi:UDP-glycosyltransferase UGT5-like [Lycorma delicatula]|uniref:UDP-glycosyltransferase UGT5-like n=1 Tax=Lycorma delicatula TaxID=130591 RepID=UPI003F51020E
MSKGKLIKLILIKCTICITCCNAANILCIFPTASYSHQQPLLTLSTALAAKGHNLTVITPNPQKVPVKNHRDIDISFLYDVFNDAKKFSEETSMPSQTRVSLFSVMNSFPKYLNFITTSILNSSQIQNLIRELNGTNYDLLIVEPLLTSGLLGFSELIGNPPIVSAVTFHVCSAVDADLGNPIIPSYIPSSFGISSDHMSLWDRIINLFIILYFDFYIVNMCVQPEQDKIMRQYFGNFKHNLWELESNKSLLIVSADLASGYSKPVHPNTVYVGPMHLKTPPPLPADLQKWMDEAEDGVIYFSLGSNMKGKSVSEEKRTAFFEAFKKFPKMRVLWKWEADTDLFGRPDNVLTRKWVPQQSVLAHPKMKIFISQIGLQSFQEATYFGIPLLCIPMFADQDFNTMKVVSSGAGIKVEFNEINNDIIFKSLEQLLKNTSYKENMMRLSLITKDKPMSAVDTALWWVEYVIRHKGAPHLRPSACDLTWYQYYMLDIFAIFILILLMSIFLIYYVTVYLIRKLLILSSKVNEKKNELKLKKN